MKSWLFNLNFDSHDFKSLYFYLFSGALEVIVSMMTELQELQVMDTEILKAYYSTEDKMLMIYLKQ